MKTHGKLIALASLISLTGCGGSSKQTLLLIDVDSSPALSGVARLHANVTFNGAQHGFDVPLKASTIPPTVSFGVSFALAGQATVAVEAFDASTRSLGTISGPATIVSGAEAHLALRFSPVQLDGGVDDLPAPDIAPPTGDLGPPPVDAGPAQDLADASISCGAELHVCGASCASNANVATCGTSCSPCPTGANVLTATCDGTQCGIQCLSGYHQCGGTCVSSSDVGSCGSSCTACPTGGAHVMNATCDGTACDVKCEPGYHECGGACVANSDVATCGASCAACAVPTGGSATCDGTQCGGSCPNGEKLCLGACIATAQSCNGSCPSGSHDCSGLCASNSSTNSCGSSCTACALPANAAASSCNGTSCDFICKTGYHKCGASCLSDSDVGSCGASCSTCPAGTANSSPICASGSCSTQCNNGYKGCGTACIPNANCCTDGDCAGTPNESGATCTGGSCKITMCSAPYADCNGTASDGCEANVNTSDGQTGATINHCGSCGGTCGIPTQAATDDCESGACVIKSCNGTYSDCDHSFGNGCEVDTRSNVSNCGGCGKACAAPPNAATLACATSTCKIASCQAGTLDCNGTYSDGCETPSDNNNCGACGNACADNEICQSGSCNTFKRVFATSQAYAGNLGGLNGADQKCTLLAKSANLTGTYKAWISSTTTSAASRVSHYAGPYAMVDRTLFANSWNDLFTNGPVNPITETETGTTPTGAIGTTCKGIIPRPRVWTDTNSQGNINSIVKAQSCEDWTVGTSDGSCTDANPCADTGAIGAGSSWTSYCTTNSCAQVGALYCFEQ